VDVLATWQLLSYLLRRFNLVPNKTNNCVGGIAGDLAEEFKLFRDILALPVAQLG